MKDLSTLALEYPLLEGAVKSGIATLETLAGGPPSVDLSYVLPGARSAIVFSHNALHFFQKHILIAYISIPRVGDMVGGL